MSIEALGDPYDGFDHTKLKEDVQGWGGHYEFFSRMVEITRPKLVVEVGTWKGRSAIAMAKAGKALAEKELREDHHHRLLTPKVVCVDTWLGATEFVGKADSDPKRGLMRVNGYPQVYYQFLSNVCYAGMQKVITPFPQTSVNAARWFMRNNVKADLIYIDGSHDYEDVVQDLEMWDNVKSSEGIMFGDDYCTHWHGVIKAVNEFAAKRGLYLQTRRYPNGPGEAPSDYWVLSRGGLDL